MKPVKTSTVVTPKDVLDSIHKTISRYTFHKESVLDNGVLSYHGSITLMEFACNLTIGFHLGLHNCVHLMVFIDKKIDGIKKETTPDLIFILQVKEGEKTDLRIAPLKNGNKIKLSIMSQDAYFLYNMIQNELYYFCHPENRPKMIG